MCSQSRHKKNKSSLGLCWCPSPQNPRGNVVWAHPVGHTAGTEPHQEGGSQASPFPKWEHQRAERPVLMKCDLTPALSHVVWQGLRSAPWWCLWPTARIPLQQLLKSTTGFWCWVTQTSAVCGAVGLKDHPQGDRSTDGTEKEFQLQIYSSTDTTMTPSQKHLDRELC